jgi:signal transduction histidine kinase
LISGAEKAGAASVFGFMSRRERRDPATGAVSVTRLIDLVRACGLLVVIVTVSLASPGPRSDGAIGVAIAVMLGLSVVAWIGWMLSGSTGDRHWLSVGSLIAMAGIGGALAGLSPNSPAVAVGCAATFSAGVRLRTEASLAITAETIAAFLITGLATGAPAGALLGYTFAYAGLWSVALTRREFLVRAEQAEHMLAETQRAREAETHAAALAERARIARDIHDVLAHSLAAVSVNLQAAEGLLTAESLPADNPELIKAKECIDRAGTLTREGLATARRAILALREDAAPLPDQLSSLAAQYRADGDATINLTVTGPPRPLSEPASQVAYRTAQEGLTNARKHAPGQPVTLGLAFGPGRVTVTVTNPLPPDDQHAPLAETGAGAGLTGLKERAALAGGTLEAGPADGTWRIDLTIPA